MKNVNKQKGITLISLIMTIVILLILAGIIISALTGSGLFIKTQQAKQETENAQTEEKLTLGSYGNTINEYVGNNRSDITISQDEYNSLISRIETLESKVQENEKIGKTLWSGIFNSGSITVEDFDQYSYLIAICDWGWAIPLYKNSDGYMYGIGGRAGKTSSANERVIMALTLTYSDTTLTYVEGKYGYLNSSNSNTNLSINKIIGIF